MTAKTGHDSATEYLQADHRRLDGIMRDCTSKAESGDMAGAAADFSRFREGLVRHIKIEEGLLFPEFEKATGLERSSGPTGVMRSEHEEILRLLGLIRELFDGSEPDAEEFLKLRSALAALLHEHNVKEERILYPMTDQMVQPDRLRELVATMRRF